MVKVHFPDSFSFCMLNSPERECKVAEIEMLTLLWVSKQWLKKINTQKPHIGNPPSIHRLNSTYVILVYS